jgi:hypothetical protein
LNKNLYSLLIGISRLFQITPEVVQKLWDINKSINELIKDTDKRLPAELSLKIRMRNNENRLNDICFGFTVGTTVDIALFKNPLDC